MHIPGLQMRKNPPGEKCRHWREKYPVVTEEKYKEPEPGRTNIYAFYDSLSKVLPEGTDPGQCGNLTCGGKSGNLSEKRSEILHQCRDCIDGLRLPAAIGVCVDPEKEVICVNGEGCMQMNLQELQTIRHHNLPIRIFVINNEGYHSIRQTQTAYFGGHLVGVGERAGISASRIFPDWHRRMDLLIKNAETVRHWKRICGRSWKFRHL